MEHVPLPTLRKQGFDSVPCVCRTEYDGGEFLTYPTRVGVHHALPLDGSVPGSSPYRQHEQVHPTPKDDIESFFQTWLFFGLISELLSQYCRPDELVRLVDGPGGRTTLISTSKIVEVLPKWIADNQADNIMPRLTYDHIAECLRLTFATLCAAGPSFDPRIKLSLASLGELLTYATNKAFGNAQSGRHNKCPSTWASLIARSYWEQQMLESGLCPSRIRKIYEGALSLQTLCYFRGIGESEANSNHQDCNTQQCVDYQVFLEDYQTRHVSEKCGCEQIVVEMSRLLEVLRNDQLPLLRIKAGEALADLSLEIEASRSDLSYVAFSHVWADGLGNPRANALCRCQLSRLYHLVESLERSEDTPDTQQPLIWIDTVCCPAEPGEGKNLALTRMKSTYEDATQVLVLDRSLESLHIGEMDSIEVCARIISTKWVQRLWTLQEGALPGAKQRLWFQFKDRAVNIGPLFRDNILIFEQDPCQRGVAMTVVNGIAAFAAFSRRHPDYPGVDVHDIEEGLNDRSVSVPSDEPLLIANLVNLDVAAIVQSPDPSRSARMQLLWKLMPNALRGIPKDIVFRIGPRLDIAGFRWAPETMLHAHPLNLPLTMARQAEDLSVPDPRGLLVSLTGYSALLASWPRGLPVNPWNLRWSEGGNAMWMRDPDGAWFILSRRLPKSQTDFLSNLDLRAIIQEETCLWLLHVPKELTDSESRHSGAHRATLGLLVSLVEDHEEIKYVRSRLHINLGLATRQKATLLEAAYQSAQTVSKSSPARRLAGKDHDNIDLSLPEYKAEFETLEAEIHQVASDIDETVITLAAAYSPDGLGLIKELVAKMFIGDYGYLGRRTADSQRWCID